MLLALVAAPQARAIEVRFVPGAAISNENGVSRPVVMRDVANLTWDWYENSAGDGSTWTLRTVDTPAQCCQAVRAGDFDRDGDPDLAVTRYNSDTVLCYANDGTPGAVGAADRASPLHAVRTFSRSPARRPRRPRPARAA